MARILIISPLIGGSSGVGRHTSYLARGLADRGHDVSTISTSNVPYVDVRRLRNPSFAFSAAVKAICGRFDVVHAHNLLSAVPMKAARGGRRVLTLHGYYSEQVALLHGVLLSQVAWLVEPLMTGWADVVTVVSKRVQEAYRLRGVSAVYVPNAIDVKGLPEGRERLYTPQVIFVGRLSREKGVDILVEAVKNVRGAHLLVVGDGPEKASLERLAKGGSVHFLDSQPWRRTIRLIRGSDLFVLPSRMEGLPTALLEAMAVGTPVVASKVGGVPEAVESGVCGVLVPPEDVEALANAISSVLSDRSLRAYMKENALRKIEEEYCWKAVLPMYLKVYGNLL